MSAGPVLHIVEPGGEGGIHQHAVELARRTAGYYRRVVVHTRSGPDEFAGLTGVTRCECFHHRRNPKHLAVIVDTVVLAYGVIFHLARSVRRRDIVHIHGTWGGLFITGLICVCRARGAYVCYSPHNVFIRSSSYVKRQALRASILTANHVFVYGSSDPPLVAAMGQGAVSLIPLVQVIPLGSEAAAKMWRERWRSLPRPIVLAAGMVRPDKRYDVLIRAVKETGRAMSCVIVGQDRGTVTECSQLAERLGVTVSWYTEYVRLDDFVGAIRAADVVVCPYERASQSGVLSIARSVGTPTISSRVGGLSDLAGQTFPAGDAKALACLLRGVCVRGMTAGNALLEAWDGVPDGSAYEEVVAIVSCSSAAPA
jgi:glycosyltransferase involved in cell wall biosynthesis